MTFAATAIVADFPIALTPTKTIAPSKMLWPTVELTRADTTATAKFDRIRDGHTSQKTHRFAKLERSPGMNS